MAAGKWIGGFLGFIMGGPLGALAGFALGYAFDKGLDSVNTEPERTTQGRAYSYQQARTQQQTSQRQRAQQGQRNSFLFSMLVLSSYIIRADGRIMHSEMEYVRRFLRANFGANAVSEGEQILIRLFEEEKRMGAADYRDTIRQCCMQIRMNLPQEALLQLLDYLAMIAKADGNIHPAEIEALKDVARWLSLSEAEVYSMLNLEKDDLASAYKVLEIEPTATNDEVKAAYRRMTLKHHPDRVATLGDDVRKAAEKKFQEINAAKERIYKARGM